MAKAKDDTPKAPRPRILEINLETGESVEREATAEEAAQMLLDAEEAAAAELAMLAHEAAKQDARARLIAGKATYEDLAILGI